MMTNETLEIAHRRASHHRDEMVESSLCACFHCEVISKPAAIREWIDADQTALCPRCGIDALIGDKSGFPITDPAFLKAMHQHWFEG
jgi:uncharacterized paraquat-inducible protein A